jgi:HAD superfamily hydrolase (TIGR01509 family)
MATRPSSSDGLAVPVISLPGGDAAPRSHVLPLRPARLPRPIDGLVFDMGGVLYDDTVWRRWLLRVLGQLGLHANYRSFYRLWDRQYLGDVHRGQREFSAAFGEFLRSVGLSPAQIDEVQAACQARRRSLEASIRPLPCVKTTLARLRQSGLVLAALTDSEYSSSILAERLERIGLGGLFGTVLSSIDLGHTRPEPVCYLTALAAMKLSASQVAFVGHDREELEGAAQVGMGTIAFNFDADARADVFIARFEQLAEVIDGPRSYAAAG